MLTLRAMALKLRILPDLGGAIGSFVHHAGGGRVTVLRGSSDAASPLDAGCFPLVPFCNRIRGGTFCFRERRINLSPNMAGDASPLHGQGWLARWRVEHHSDKSATLSFLHERAEWPWRYQAHQRFDLDPSGLAVELRCRNEDDLPMPCGLGFHPYSLARPRPACGPGSKTSGSSTRIFCPSAGK
jgi:aldose 1-epimerase